MENALLQIPATKLAANPHRPNSQYGKEEHERNMANITTF